MVKLIQIIKCYTNLSIKVQLILFTIISTITPIIALNFLKCILNYINGSLQLSKIVCITILYIVASFLGPYVSQILETNLSEYRLAYIVTKYYETCMSFRIDQTMDDSVQRVIRSGNVFSYQSWKGYQRLLRSSSTIFANLLTIAILILMNNSVVAIIIVVMLIFSLISTVLIRKNSDYYKEIDELVSHQKSHTKFYSDILIDAKSLQEIKASNYEGFIEHQLFQRIGSFYELIKKTIKQNLMRFYGMSFSSSLPYVFAVMIMGYCYLSGKINLINVIVNISLIKIIQDILKNMIRLVEKSKADLKSYDDYMDFLALAATSEKSSGDEFDFSVPLTIEFKNVSYRYNQKSAYVLKNFNYVFYPSKRYAIVGESGAGKSTLVKLLCGFIKPTEGVVCINYIDLNTLNLESYQKIVTAVFQKSDLLSFTFEDNLLRYHDDVGILEDYVEKIGMSNLIKRLPNGLSSYYTRQMSDDGISLSGGELQMFTLLRAVLKPAQLYLLDEPTSAMDVNNEQKTIESFLTFTEKKTAIIVTHRLLITRYCDNILVLKDGELIESGSHSQLIKKKGYYNTLYNIQNEGYGKSSEKYCTQ